MQVATDSYHCLNYWDCQDHSCCSERFHLIQQYSLVEHSRVCIPQRSGPLNCAAVICHGITGLMSVNLPPIVFFVKDARGGGRVSSVSEKFFNGRGSLWYRTEAQHSNHWATEASGTCDCFDSVCPCMLNYAHAYVYIHLVAHWQTHILWYRDISQTSALLRVGVHARKCSTKGYCWIGWQLSLKFWHFLPVDSFRLTNTNMRAMNIGLKIVLKRHPTRASDWVRQGSKNQPFPVKEPRSFRDK